MGPSDQDHARDAGPSGGRWRDWLADAERLDVAVYAAIAETPTPALDRGLARPDARRRPLEALARVRRRARARRRAGGSASGGHGACLARRDVAVRQCRPEAGGKAPAPGSSRARRARIPTGADAGLALVPLGAQRGGVRVRHGGRRRFPGRRDPVARPRGRGRLLEGPYRRPLSRRRDRRGARGRYAR